MHSVPDLRIELKPSRMLPWIVSIAHLIAFCAAMLSGLPAWAVAVVLASIGGSLAWSRRAWRQATQTSTLILRGDGTALKVSAGGTAEIGDLVATAVWPWLVVLRGRPVRDGIGSRWPESIVLPIDGLAERADFRRLRRWVLWVAASGRA